MDKFIETINRGVTMNTLADLIIDLMIVEEIITSKKIFAANIILRGGQFMDAGYVYAPYIPVYRTPEVVDMEIAKIPKKLLDRYATTKVDKKFYEKIEF